ncbi:MAG: class I SAM-dependent methyltransferase [bacterium]|nr:class I SAM-dependent methyltransferase [bacterium]
MKKQSPHDFRISLTEEELKLFKKFKIKNILEVFCGDGRNLVALRELGYDTTGIEELIFEKALPFENESFDAVYSWQCINHNLKNKIENVFKEIYRVLKVNGIFSIKISDFEQLNFKQIGESLYEEQDLEFGKMQYKMIAPQTFIKLSGDEKDIPHYAFYQDELKECLEKIDFQQINSRKIKWNIVANFKKIDKNAKAKKEHQAAGVV